MKSKTIVIFSFALLLNLLVRTGVSGQEILLEEAFPDVSISNILGLVSAAEDSPYLYALSQEGRIYRLDTREPGAEPVIWLDISGRLVSGGERGLLGLAFHPRFSENKRIYINYTAPSPLRTIVSRFAADEDEADPESEQIILEFDQPFNNHNAGQTKFGPDGFLYIASGDGGGAGDPEEHGQDTQTLLGNMLRIDVDNQDDDLEYAIPDDNPFAGSDEGRAEIFAWGLRNPWRFSFDMETGLLWTADVGQDDWEAIHIIENGKNYGWNIIEGSHCYPPGSECDTAGLEMPVFEYSPQQGERASVTGGYVYRGSEIPGLQGRYIYGDFVSGRIWALEYDSDAGEVISNTLLADTDHRISSFGRGTDGELYVLSYSTGEIFRIAGEPVAAAHSPLLSGVELRQNYPNPFNPVTLISFSLAQPAPVLLQVYDITGRLVATLIDAPKSAGRHDIRFHAGGLSAGMYYYRLTAGEYTETRKMLYIK